MSFRTGIRWQMVSAATIKEAKKDAEVGHHDPQAVVISLLGPEPATADQRISTREDQAALTTDLDEGVERELEAHDRASDHTRPIYLRSLIFVVILAEYLGLVMLLRRNFGWSPAESNVLGAGLTAGSIFCARLAFSDAATRTKLFGVGVFVVMALSLATLRHEEARQKIGGSPLNQGAATVIMAIISILPPIFAEHLLKRLPDSVRAWRTASRFARRRKQDGRAFTKAQKIHDRRADDHDEWMQMATRITAAYERAYRHARARLGKQPVDES